MSNKPISLGMVLVTELLQIVKSSKSSRFTRLPLSLGLDPTRRG
jgi:hypothetical protein